MTDGIQIMSVMTPVSLLRSAGGNDVRGKARFMLGNARALAHWPLFFVISTAILWAWVAWVVSDEKADIRDRLITSAAAHANASSEQIERSVGQIDYLMLSLKYHWQKTGGAVDLEEQVRAGLVPQSTDLSVTIFDAAGIPVTSTVLGKKNAPSIAHRQYFTAHAADPHLGLSISEPMTSVLKRQVIFLSRRLSAPNGAFAGVIVVAIEPRYLLSLSDDSALGPNDFMAVRRKDGVFFAARQAGRPVSFSPIVGNYVAGAKKSGSALRAAVTGLRVTGIIGGPNPRAIIDGQMYRTGDIVDPQRGYRITKIDADKRSIDFTDQENNTATRILD